MSSLAPVKWAQRKDKVYLTIGLRDLSKEKGLEISVEAQAFHFKGVSDGKTYTFSVDLFAEVLPEETVQRNHGLQLEMQIFKKAQEESYWPRLTKEKKKMVNLKVNWDKYCDSDEENEVNDEDDG